MTKPNVTKLIKGVKMSMVKHSPEILTGIGIAGMIATTVLAVKATPKALRLIEDAECTAGCKLKPVDKVKTCWKCYIPSVVAGSTSIACLIGANSVHSKRNATLAAAYKLSETALIEYRDKVVEAIGEKKEQSVRDKVAAEQLKKNPISQNEVIVTKKGGNTSCYDYLSGRYFESDIELVKKGLNQLNGILLREDTVSLNDFYDEIGLPHVGIGDDFGWNIGRVGRDLVKLSLSYQGDEDDNPCVVIAFDPMPQPNYLNYM